MYNEYNKWKESNQSFAHKRYIVSYFQVITVRFIISFFDLIALMYAHACTQYVSIGAFCY